MCDIGRRLISKGRPHKTQPEDEPAAVWLEERDLACRNSKGRLVLQSAALAFATVLGKLERVRDPPKFVGLQPLVIATEDGECWMDKGIFW